MKKALVLSGGGARGAYHIGVIQALVDMGWMPDGRGPDIIAGTSIGAINAAALASGRTAAQLRAAWLGMHTEDVHRLSAEIPPVARPLLRFLLRGVLTSQAHGGAEEELPAAEASANARSVLARLGELFRVRPFRSLLDTAPWRRTLARWMDFERVNGPDAPALLLTATDVQSGALRVFCNRPLGGRPADRIGIEHLMASSSIPGVYPWTKVGAASYWDGAVVANTPLDPVVDLAGEDELEIVVVMMTPWSAEGGGHAPAAPLPQDLAQAVTLTLDWALLGSYRVAFELLEQRNRLADAVERMLKAGVAPPPGPRPRRIATPTVIAPREPMPLDWIVDYEEANHRALFKLGYADARDALVGRSVGA